jgi:hypothetical protein
LTFALGKSAFALQPFARFDMFFWPSQMAAADSKKVPELDKHTYDDLINSMSKGFVQDKDKMKRIKVL